MHLLATTPIPAVQSVAFSPNGKLIAASSGDDKIRVWNLETGKQISCWSSFGMVSSMVFSPDSTKLASAHWGFRESGHPPEHGIKVWDVKGSGGQILNIRTTEGVRTVSFSSYGSDLIGGTDAIKIWKSETGKFCYSLSAPSSSSSCQAIALDHKNQILAGGFYDGTVAIWDMKTRKFVREFRPYLDNEIPSTGYSEGNFEIGNIAFTEKGLLIIGNFFYGMRLWNPITGEEESLEPFCSLLRKVKRFAVSPNGVIAIFHDESLTVLSSNFMPYSQVPHSEFITCFAFGSDSLPLLVGCNKEEEALEIWGV